MYLRGLASLDLHQAKQPQRIDLGLKVDIHVLYFKASKRIADQPALSFSQLKITFSHGAAQLL